MTVLVIQALKTLGKTNVTSKTIQTLSSRLNEDDKAAMLREAAESTDYGISTWEEKITDSLNDLFLLKAIVKEGHTNQTD